VAEEEDDEEQLACEVERKVGGDARRAGVAGGGGGGGGCGGGGRRAAILTELEQRHVDVHLLFDDLEDLRRLQQADQLHEADLKKRARDWG
jgi:hypothetical protein